MDWRNGCHRFDFDDHAAAYNDVSPVAAIQLRALIYYGDGFCLSNGTLLSLNS